MVLDLGELLVDPHPSLEEGGALKSDNGAPGAQR